MAQTYEVTTRQAVEFAVHDGVKLIGDLYAPKRDKAPVLAQIGWEFARRVGS